MLKLSQRESNILYWSKYWYGSNRRENFWPQLKILCDEYFGMDCDVEDIYEAVRQVWKKILNVLPNKEHFWDEYERETLPSKARYYWGSPNFANRDWHCKDSFDEEQMICARVAKMISQIAITETKYYESMMPEDVGDLKVENREKLQEMMNKREQTLDSAE
jgi:hypothetical protein